MAGEHPGHFAVLGHRERNFEVSNPWFSGGAAISTYHFAELLGTKVRALYQRKKGRDHFDLHLGLTESEVDDADVVRCFLEYMASTGTRITRAQFEANMDEKLRDPLFVADIGPLLRPGTTFDLHEGWRIVHDRIITRLPGEPWKGGHDPGDKNERSEEKAGGDRS